MSRVLFRRSLQEARSSPQAWQMALPGGEPSWRLLGAFLHDRKGGLGGQYTHAALSGQNGGAFFWKRARVSCARGHALCPRQGVAVRQYHRGIRRQGGPPQTPRGVVAYPLLAMVEPHASPLQSLTGRKGSRVSEGRRLVPAKRHGVRTSDRTL
jgi:hypothetical protein